MDPGNEATRDLRLTPAGSVCSIVQPALVTAQGLLPYFERAQVHMLIAAVGECLPGESMIADVVPQKMLDVARGAPGRESAQATKLWSWTFNNDERAAITMIPGVAGVRDLVPPIALGVAPLLLSLIRRLPRRWRYVLPVFPVLEVTFV
jgi:hypothetical protein